MGLLMSRHSLRPKTNHLSSNFLFPNTSFEECGDALPTYPNPLLGKDIQTSEQLHLRGCQGYSVSP